MSPEAAIIQDVLVGAMIISIMLSVGLDLTPNRFAAVFRRPRVLVIGLLVNHIAVPACAWGFCVALDVSPPVTAGLLLCAAAPGGAIGTLLVLHARGDLALSVSLVVVMTLINTVTTPLTLSVLDIAPTGAASPIGLSSMAQTIAVYVLIPTALGMTVRRVRPLSADRALPFVSRFSKIAFGLVFVGLTATQGHRVVDVGGLALLAIEFCVLVSLLLGALLTPGPAHVRATVSLNSGVRNLALSLLLATLWFNDGDTLLTAMVYGLMMLVNGVPLSFWWRRRTA